MVFNRFCILKEFWKFSNKKTSLIFLTETLIGSIFSFRLRKIEDTNILRKDDSESFNYMIIYSVKGCYLPCITYNKKNISLLKNKRRWQSKRQNN